MAELQNQNQNQRERPYGAVGEQLIPEASQVSLPWRLMIFSLVLFIFSIFVFVGLKFGYGNFLDAQIEGADASLAALTEEISAGEQEEFLNFYSQLVNLENILKRRGFSQNIFKFLENNTLPLVYYTEARYSADDLSVSLSGRAASMTTFVNQMTVFENAGEVERAIIEAVSFQKGEITFGIKLVFNRDFFKQIR